MENIPDTPEGKLFLAVIEGFHEYFSESLKQKVNRGKLFCGACKQRDDAKRAADNIIKAIKQGIIMDLTKDKLMNLQNQIDRYEIEIDQAMQKTYAHSDR